MPKNQKKLIQELENLISYEDMPKSMTEIIQFLIKNNIDFSTYSLNNLLFQSEKLYEFIGTYSKKNLKENILTKSYEKINDVTIESDLGTYSLSSIQQYIQDINVYPILNEEEIRHLFLEYHKGNHLAYETILCCNLRLVVLIAHKYHINENQFLDCIQEGNIGLIKAIEKYNINLGFRFSTYAVYYIRRNMITYLNHNFRQIYYPKKELEGIKSFQKVLEDLKEQEHQEPSLKELASKSSISYQKARDYYQVLQSEWSIETPITENITLKEVLKDENEEIDKEDYFFTEEMQKFLETSHLNPRDKEIVKEYYGINCPRLKQEEIGYKWNLTHQRVHQVIDNALDELREEETFFHMANYLDTPEKSQRKLYEYLTNHKKHFLKLIETIFDTQKLDVISVEDWISKEIAKWNPKDQEIVCLYYGIHKLKETSKSSLCERYHLNVRDLNLILKSLEAFLKSKSSTYKNLDPKSSQVNLHFSKKKRDTSNLYHYFSEYDEKIIQVALLLTPVSTVNYFYTIYGTNLKETNNTENKSKKFFLELKKFSSRVKWVVTNPDFLVVLKTSPYMLEDELSLTEKLVFTLAKNYDKKNSEIARLLGLSLEEVRDILTKDFSLSLKVS